MGARLWRGSEWDKELYVLRSRGDVIMRTRLSEREGSRVQDVGELI